MDKKIHKKHADQVDYDAVQAEKARKRKQRDAELFEDIGLEEDDPLYHEIERFLK